ncbi:MAG: DNA polymerase III subunit, partial [Clostridiales bacterium]|nr:DNA polymerase III subunit [Clostridiales bacterium]
MSFDGIYGHEEIKKRLSAAAANGTASHAYIFCGGAGIGKTMTARAFADALTDGSGADVIVVTNAYYGVKDKAALSVETVRAARVDMYTKPYLADRRVFLFPEAETMTAGAQNALLKVFEEPPPYCVILLLTQNEYALLPTVRSRAVTVRFSPLPDATVRRYLTERYGVADSVAVGLAAGSIAAADELASQGETTALAREFAAVLQRFSGADKRCVYEVIAIFEREKAQFDVLLGVM